MELKHEKNTQYIPAIFLAVVNGESKVASHCLLCCVSTLYGYMSKCCLST